MEGGGANFSSSEAESLLASESANENTSSGSLVDVGTEAKGG